MNKMNYEEKVEKLIDEIIKNIKLNLRIFRNNRNEKAEFVAKKAHMSKGTIYNLENHSPYIMVRSLLKLCIYYKKSFGQVLFFDEKIFDDIETLEKLDVFIKDSINDIKNNLRRIRLERKESLACASDNANISKRTLLKLETNSKYTIVKSILKLCFYYKKTISDLFVIDDQINDFIKNEDK